MGLASLPESVEVEQYEVVRAAGGGKRFMVETAGEPLNVEQYIAGVYETRGHTVFRTENNLWKNLATVLASEHLKDVQTFPSWQDAWGEEYEQPIHLPVKTLPGRLGPGGYERFLGGLAASRSLLRVYDSAHDDYEIHMRLLERRWSKAARDDYVARKMAHFAESAIRIRQRDPSYELPPPDEQKAQLHESYDKAFSVPRYAEEALDRGVKARVIVEHLDGIVSMKVMAAILDMVYTHSGRSLRGFPDLLAFREGRVVFVEVKGPTDKLRPEQGRVMTALSETLGMEVRLATLVEERG